MDDDGAAQSQPTSTGPQHALHSAPPISNIDTPSADTPRRLRKPRGARGRRQSMMAPGGSSSMPPRTLPSPSRSTMTNPILLRFSQLPPQFKQVVKAQEWLRQSLEQVDPDHLTPDEHSVGLECLQCEKIRRYRLDKVREEDNGIPLLRLDPARQADLERKLNNFKVRCDSCPKLDKGTDADQQARKRARGLFLPRNRVSLAESDVGDDLMATTPTVRDGSRRGRDHIDRNKISMDRVREQVVAMLLWAKAVFALEGPLETMTSSDKLIDGALHCLGELTWPEQDRVYNLAKIMKHTCDELVGSRMKDVSMDMKKNKDMVETNEMIWLATHYPAKVHAVENPQMCSTESTRYGALSSKLRPAFISSRGELSCVVQLSYTFKGQTLKEVVASDELKDFMRLVDVSKEGEDADFARKDVLFVEGCDKKSTSNPSYLHIIPVTIPYHSPMLLSRDPCFRSASIYSTHAWTLHTMCAM